MPGSKFKGTLGALLAASVCLFASRGTTAQLQQPRVGGSGTLDGASSGSGGGSSRRPLGSLAPTPEDFSHLAIAPGFLLSMDVYDTPEFSNDLRVDSDGNVQIAMVGAVHVGGQTLAEAANTIAQRLRDGKILNNPQVTLNISQYSSMNISVLGEVHNPGRMELLAPHNLADVIALAGGETQYAGNTIEIRHSSGGGPQVEKVRYSRDSNDPVLSDSMVRPGDIITVRRAGIVYVLGSVNRPGGYVMQEDGELNFSQAISLAYGTSINAAVSSIRIIHQRPDGGVSEQEVSYRDIMKGKTPPPRLQAEDVIYVPVSKLKTVLSAGLIGTAAQATIYRVP